MRPARRRVRVWYVSPEQFRELRHGCLLSRKACAEYLGVSLRTVRHWDAGRNRVPWSVVRMLRVLRMGDLLPGYWGTGRSASADGTKWSVYEQNILSEYHIRYGGYGGIGYYHVSDKYIALFSRFIPCGAYEAIYILDGLIENRSDIRPDTVHGDTQAQNFPVFGLAHLLGIELMPRIRNIKDLSLSKPDPQATYPHIQALFGSEGSIEWNLIPSTLAPKDDFLALVIAIPPTQLVADVGDTLATERIAFFIEYLTVQQFSQPLRSRQHGIPGVECRNGCGQGHEEADAGRTQGIQPR